MFVLKTKFGQDKDVFLQEFHVQMEEYGMKKYMLVNVLMEPSQMLINATLFLPAEMDKPTIP